MALTLLQARQEFVDKTGRFDLVVDTTNYVDNGANFFLQAGQRYLDTVLPNPTTIRAHRVDMVVGDYNVYIKHLRWIETVEIFDATGRIGELFPLSWTELQDQYPKVISAQTSGTPTFYADGVHLPSPEQEALLLGDYSSTFSFDVDTLSFASTRVEDTGIEFRPKTDVANTIKITGGFFSLLDADTDVTYHSQVYPEVFVLAGIMAMDAFLNNRAGVQDALEAMKIWLRGQDHNEIFQQMAKASVRVNGKHTVKIKG